MTTNIVLIVGAVLMAGLFFHPRVLRSKGWRATVTPLASIIGSGFLVAGPILADAAGRLAWAAMIGLCALGYLYGAVMRHNILWLQPHEAQADRAAAWIERASDLLLSLAYFISVAYYLNLFAAFGLRMIDVQDPFQIRLVAAAAIVTIGLVGFLGGLRALERVEIGAVGLKLSVIGGLLLALALNYALGAARGAPPPALTHDRGLDEMRVLMGLVILVQGFETSRYLGEEYDAETRVRTMRHAQWIATGIYVVFIVLVTPLFRDSLPAMGGETAIIDMLRPLGGAAGPLLIAAALASQSSAAVADLNGASGLLSEAAGAKVSVRIGNLVTALAALAITWSADIYQIIAYASKAFVAYYALQSIQAARSAWSQGMRLRAAAFGAGVAVGVAIVLFAIPAKA